MPFLIFSRVPRTVFVLSLACASLAPVSPLHAQEEGADSRPLVPSAPAASTTSSLGGDAAAALLLARARQNQYAGDFFAAVVCVRESFLGGRDTLRGLLEVRESTGERRLTLRGANGSFQWWSRLRGREQWRRDGAQGRVRRIPPHSLKKPSFAPDVSYEDLTRLPFGHLDGIRAARRAGETDSSTMLELVPGPGLAMLYASLEATFAKPALLRRVVFKGSGVRPSKTMEIARYTAVPGGLFPAEIVFTGGDGLSSTRLLLTHLGEEPARDKASVADEMPRGFAEPEWVPRDGTGAGE